MTEPKATTPPASDFSGERYLPEIGGQIAFEHFHRYRFASRLVEGKDVLDVACGEGYGSDLLARAGAATVTGVDIAADVVAHASERYRGRALRFTVASAASLPFEDASFDIVVSFETIEHHDQHREMLAEIKRVLRPSGLLVISSPNRQHYSIETGYVNPFHVKELFHEEFVALLAERFAHCAIYGQRVVHGSLIIPDAMATFESTRQEPQLRRADGLLAPMYDLAIASDGELPAPVASLFETRIHGMDPASYYGVHLQERVNEADRECGKLRSWLAELQTHADSLQEVRQALERQLAALQADSTGLQRELAARLQRISDLERELAGHGETLRHERSLHQEVMAGLRHEQALRMKVTAGLQHEQALRTELEARLGEGVARVSGLEQEIAAHAEALRRERAQASSLAEDLEREIVARRESEAASKQELARRDVALRDVAARLSVARAELGRVLASNSWRWSAPLRWARSHLDAILNGRKPLHFEQAMGVARLQDASTEHSLVAAPANLQPAHPHPRTAQAQLPAHQAYLDALFAEDHASRSPDYCPRSDAPDPAASELRARLIAFYLPQFHPFAENDAWWGKGFTEWINVTRARPQFVGHEQPHLPADLGFYDLRLPEVIRQQVELARQYGIHGFCFHYYWFAGRRLLERPLDLFMQASDIDFPFCLCWANENWTRRWDGHDHEVLIAQDHTPENDLAFIQDLEPYLRDARYIRVDGRPLVIVYRPSLLPDCAATLRRWRQHCREAGVGEIFLAMAQFDVEDPRVYGFDAALEFPPHKLAAGLEPINDALEVVNPHYRGHVVHYQSIVDAAREWPAPGFPLIRGVFPGWDNEARRPGRGYTFAYATPRRYRDWLESAVGYAEHHPVAGERIVMVNAWNEWAEGAYLEPDRRHGHAFLQATRDVLVAQGPGVESQRVRRIAVVSHDAHPHGAQYLALHLCRELRAMGFDVDAILLGGGVLEGEFRAVACRVHTPGTQGGDEAGHALAAELAARGIRHAIANTSVSGLFAGDLAGAGIRVVALVHELPGVLREFGLQAHAASLAANAHRVFFAAEAVQKGFCGFVPLAHDKQVVRPQGLYKRNSNRSPVQMEAARRRLRERLGLPAGAEIILGVGYADLRKGADLFVAAGVQIAGSRPQAHMVWLGHVDPSLDGALREAISTAGMQGRIHFVGRDPDTDDYYAGADLLALTSREDPFPSVVMEALDVGVPVVAFAGTGGSESLLRRGGGRLVDRVHAGCLADACIDLLDDPVARAGLGEQGRRLVQAEFSFRAYAFDLLAALGVELPRVSVVVPNYNYARYLRERLQSIATQTLPPYEIIVLDDASTDDSRAVLHSIASDTELRLYENESNSGSVFRQWQRGVELAQGDFVWIAEADDLSDPRFLETVVGRFKRDDVVMGYCQSMQIDAAGTVLATDYLDYVSDISRERWREPFVATGDVEVANGLAIKNTIPNVSAVVFRRCAIREVLASGLEEIASFRIAGDWLAYLMLLQHGSLAFVPEALNRHRRHGASVTIGSDMAPHLHEVLRMQEIARTRYGAEDEARRARDYAERLFSQFGLATEAMPSFAAWSRLAGEAR